MNNANRDSLTTSFCHSFSGFFDRFGPPIFGLLLLRRPAGNVNGCTCGAEFSSDATTGPASAACHKGDLGCQHHIPPRWLGRRHKELLT